MSKRIKLLVVTDDIRIKSGVGIQAYKICTGLQKTGKYDVVVMAGSLQAHNPQPVMLDDIKLYPVREYGNQQIFREIYSIEQPDIVLCFSDPRFFEYIFQIDNEIRKKSRLLLYHTWDNTPFPDYNLPWYSSCDHLVMISNFSYDLFRKRGLHCSWIPHGISETEFFPLTPAARDVARKQLLQAAGIVSPVNFIVFYNGRNISRKRPGDTIMAFDDFARTHPDTALLMNTEVLSEDGGDLRQLIERQCVTPNIILNFKKVSTADLNTFYNIADVTINIAHTEGHGLCVTESLAAGTPVIATETGGITAQIRTKTGTQFKEQYDAGMLLPPAVRNLFATPTVPYHYYDYVSHEQVVKALNDAYHRLETDPEGWHALGAMGREHMLAQYNDKFNTAHWDKLLTGVLSEPSQYKRVNVAQL